MTFVLIAVLAIAWFLLRIRVVRLEAALDAAGLHQSEITSLARRVSALEELNSSRKPESATAQTLPLVVEPVPVRRPPERVAVEPIPSAPPTVTPAAPTPQEPIAQSKANQWESLIGGSILNAVGAIVLVIGISLFLAYSFAHLNAIGRAGLALAASLGILAAGMWMERRPRYQVFARGLIGAGWAALYATAYAVYAIPAARIVPNAFAGSAILLGVALGMIGHSLRYRAQTITVVAYAAVFAALAATPSTPFAVFSLLPIAVSALYLGTRFEWDAMPLFAMIATYLTCISRSESGASLASSQTLFLAYWLIFELFDLRRVKRARIAGGLELLFPLNTAGFLGLSFLVWSRQAPDRLWLAAACASALFLASAITRAILRSAPAGGSEEPRRFIDRLREGSYEGSITVSVLLAIMAIGGRVPGAWVVAGLALEAEILYVAGVRFGSRFLRGLGSAVFAYSLGRLATVTPSGPINLLGHPFLYWTPMAIFHASLFYLNRLIRPSSRYFGYAASGLLGFVLLAEVPWPSVGFTWALFGCVLLELGVSLGLAEFRTQAYGLLTVGVFAACVYPVANSAGSWWPLAATLALTYAAAIRFRHEAELAKWLSAAACACSAVLLWRIIPLEYLALSWAMLALILFELGALHLPTQLRRSLGPMLLLAATAVMTTHSHLYKHPPVADAITYAGICLGAWVAAAQLTLWPPRGSAEWELRGLRDAIAALGMLCALSATWMVAPDPAIGVVWTALAIILLEIGVARQEPSFYLLALGTIAAACARVFSWDLADSDQWTGVTECVIPVAVSAAGVYWMWRRFRLSPDCRHEPQWIRLLLWIPPVLAFFAVNAHAASLNIALWLASFALALEMVGQACSLSNLKWQARTLAGLASLWCLADTTYPPHLFISIPTAALLYAAYFVARRGGDKRASWYFSLLGTLLSASILHGYISGGLLTVALGLLGLSLLASGFIGRERILRLQGLALLLICILKLFLYDLRSLETVYRILSFVALGLILLLVSWIYTRFRDQVERLL